MFLSARLVLITLLGFAPLPAAMSVTSQPPLQVSAANSRLAIPFITNVGQKPPAVTFYAPTAMGTAFVTNDGQLVYTLDGSSRGACSTGAREGFFCDGRVVTETFHDAHRLTPRVRRPSHVDVTIFSGSRTGISRIRPPAAETLVLGEPWAGVSVALRAYNDSVEKVFKVTPTGNVSSIRVDVDGINSLTLDGDTLVGMTGDGSVTFNRPRAYQRIGGTEKPVAVRYVLKGPFSYGFELGPHRKNKPVVIDPTVQATYLGGFVRDGIASVAVGPDGSVYAAGYSTSSDFPGTTGGAQEILKFNDAVVAKLSPALKRLEQATYLGGSLSEFARDIAVDADGNVYVIGTTDSDDFPVSASAAQATPGGGFVAKLSGDLRQLLAATYLGGTAIAGTTSALAIASDGTVYITGSTGSDFPATTGGAQPVSSGRTDAFVARLSPDLSLNLQSTYFGGSGYDSGTTIVVTATQVYVGGNTDSSDLPAVAGGAKPSGAAFYDDGFVAKFSPDLTQLDQATYLGGATSDDTLSAIAPGPSSRLYAVGSTQGSDFPGNDCSSAAASDQFGAAFAVALSDDLTAIGNGWCFGGSLVDSAYDVAVDASGNVYVAGLGSPGFPTTAGTLQSGSSDSSAAFVSEYSAGLGSLLRSALFRGAAHSTALASSGDIYIGGNVHRGDLPYTAGGAQEAYGPNDDGYVARLPSDLTATVVLKMTSGAPAKVGVSAAYEYTINLANVSDYDSATGIKLVDDLPEGVEFQDATADTGNCSAAAQQVTCNIDSLAAGGGDETIVIRVKSPAYVGMLHNVAHVDAVDQHLDPGSTDTTSLDTTVVAPPEWQGPGSLTLKVGHSGTVQLTSTSTEPLTYSVVSSDSELVPAGGISLDPKGGAAGPVALSIQPARGKSGIAVVTVTATDDVDQAARHDIEVQVIDSPPIAADLAISATAGQAVSGQLEASDADAGQQLMYVVVSEPAHGALQLDAATGAFKYVSSESFSGADVFTYRANDGYRDSNIAKVSITVNAAAGSGGNNGDTGSGSTGSGTGATGGGGGGGWMGVWILLLFAGAQVVRRKSSHGSRR